VGDKRLKRRKNYKITVRKFGDIVRITMFSCHDNFDKFFEMEAPLHDTEKVKALLKAAKLKGLPIKSTDEEEAWW
jgi:hypothetical protein